MATAILTRDRAETQAYAEALAPLGLSVVAMPVTRTETAADPDALVRALLADTYAAIVVASPRAAHELARAHVRAAIAADALPEIWAVGPATCRELEVAGLTAQWPDDVRNGAELAARFASSRDARGLRVLVPRAEEGRAELIDGLRDAGAIVVDVVAYRTVRVPSDDPAIRAGAELLATGGAAICVVFAPSQVTALVELMAAPLADLAVRFCAIGETTAATLRAAGIVEVAVAPTPTPEGMAHAVGSVYPPRT